MSATPWWVELFQGDYYRFAGRHVPEDVTRLQVEFVERVMELRPGDRVLDLCCGWGRHSVALAAHGYRVTGLDLSESELAEARRAAEEAGVTVEWVHADMREAPPGPFDAVINLFTSFGYFEDEAEDQRVLDGVGRALRPGGRFLIDLPNAFRTFAGGPGQWVQEQPDGTLVLDQWHPDLRTLRTHAVFTFVAPDGDRRRHPFSVRNYTARELERMLEEAGMRVVDVWGDWTGRPFQHDSLRMITLAERAA